MNEELRAYVIDLLDSYRMLSKRIALYHYEISRRADVTQDKTIEALALTHGEGGIQSIGHVSDKTLYIALNYQEQTELINWKSKGEIASRLVQLEKQQNRLKHYVSLLEPPRGEVIRLLFFEGHSQEECAKILGISTRTVRRHKEEGIDELTELYSFMDGFNDGQS